MSKSGSLAVIVAMAVTAFGAAQAEEGGWDFEITPYVWGVGIHGDVGVKDVSTAVDVPFSRILETLELGGMLSLEARKNRWALLMDGVYMSISDDLETPGPFFNTIDTTVENGTADMALAYRVVQGERGWLDLLAGARYVYVSLDLDMNPDYEAVDQISSALVDQIVTAARGSVETSVKNAADGIADELAALKEDVGEAARDKIREQVQGKIDQAVDEIIDRIESIPPPIRDDLKDRIQDRLDNLSDAQRDAIADAVKDRINGQIEAIKGDANAIREQIGQAAGERIASLRAKASAQVRKALDEAEKEIASAIEEGMKKAAAADVHASRDWVDPYVGIRGRLNLTERTYAGARADVGGFGVGSDLMVQLFGGIGYRPTRNVEIEAGWRYMAVDYDKDNFVYDVEYSGAVVGVKFIF